MARWAAERLKNKVTNDGNSQGSRLLCVGQSQGVVSSERALDEQRVPLLASAPRLELRDLKLFVAIQSASHREPFPLISQGLGSHASHLLIRDFVIWRKPRTRTSTTFASSVFINAEYRSAHKGNGCHCLAVLPQSRRNPLSFEANHSLMFSMVALAAIR